MFNHKTENILGSYISAGLLSSRLSANVLSSFILEAAACKIVEDCHQVVENNIDRYFSSLQDMVPVLSSKILNSDLPVEELVDSIIYGNLEILLSDINRDIAGKFAAAKLAGTYDFTGLTDKVPGGDTFKADVTFIIESKDFSLRVSVTGLKLCETILDKLTSGSLGCFFNKSTIARLLWNQIKTPGREEQLAEEMQKRLKGLLNNLRLYLLNNIKDKITQLVFQRYDQIYNQLPEEIEILDGLALTA